jgi:hypothetical protein
MRANRTPRSEKAESAPQAGASRGFEKELAELEALRERLLSGSSPDPLLIEHLRKALAHRNNFLVGKAAKLTADAGAIALLPDLVAAFDRFFIDAAKTDPQCWAKNALSKALVKLEYRDKDAYLRGMRHHQFEPVWGGQSDTAGALRGTCTHALVDCEGISDADLLTALLDPFTDADKTVRVEAARAIGQVRGAGAAVLLRLYAKQGKNEPEPEVMGAVYASLLALEGAAAIPLVAEALEEGGDASAEAAFALAEMRSAEALAVLLKRFDEGADAWFSSALLSAIAITRLPEALEFLIAKIADDSHDAPEAIEAIGRTAPSPEVRGRVERAIELAGSSRLRKALLEHFPAVPE